MKEEEYAILRYSMAGRIIKMLIPDKHPYIRSALRFLALIPRFAVYVFALVGLGSRLPDTKFAEIAIYAVTSALSILALLYIGVAVIEKDMYFEEHEETKRKKREELEYNRQKRIYEIFLRQYEKEQAQKQEAKDPDPSEESD